MVGGNFENRVREVLSRRSNSSEDIIAKTVAGATHAYQVSQDDDIFAVINDALDKAGQDSKVIVENGIYKKSNNQAVESQLQTTAEGQFIAFQGSDFELADGVDRDMIKVSHDSCRIINANFDGNQSNNDITNIVKTEPTVLDIVLENVECGNAPVGIHLDSADESTLRQSGTELGAGAVGTPIYLENCTDTSVGNAKFSSFTNQGIEIENCTAIALQDFAVVLSDGSTVDSAIHIVGSQGCEVKGALTARGNCKKGLHAEPFDVGGDEERICTRNNYDLNISGVTEIGFHLEDSKKSKVTGLLDGEYPTGRSDQAFLIEEPNGLANSQHSIDISGSKIDRITDTDLTATNVGLRVEGHYSKVQNVSNVTFGGNSVSQFTFGEATPNPVVNIGSGTRFVVRQSAKKEKTGGQGTVEIDWSKSYAFEEKPVINVTLEQPGQWYVDSYSTDSSGRYTAATIQVTDSSGTPVGNNVRVNAKLEGT